MYRDVAYNIWVTSLHAPGGCLYSDIVSDINFTMYMYMYMVRRLIAHSVIILNVAFSDDKSSK